MGQISLQIPQSGQLFSTEGPKVATDLTLIQTVINGNLDSTNLNVSAAIARSQMAGGFGNLATNIVGVNTSCIDGTLYFVTAASTMTLPAPTLNRTIGVRSSIASGAVTITASSGVITGVGTGAGGVASIQLGTTYATVILQADGSNWNIVAGQQDTGWVALTLPGSWAAQSGSYVPAVRLIGDRVLLRGSANNGTGGSANLTLTIPVGFRPAATVTFPLAILNLAAAAASISTAGAFTSTSVPNTLSLCVDGANYQLV